MPDRAAILAALTEIANRTRGVAMFWHVAFAVAAAAWAFGLRPSRRVQSLLLSAPLMSAALCAMVFANPFNALVLGVGAAALAALAARSPAVPVTLARAGWARIAGAVLLAFGVVYPHFLPGSALQYLYAAPLGTIPCPTLSAAIGLALLGDGLAAGAWSWLLAGLGLFYGVFGVFRLGVTLDVVLLAGALGLCVQSVGVATRGNPSTSASARASGHSSERGAQA